MLQKIRYKIAQFMVGRYGMDQFSQFLGFLCFALLVIGMFVRGAVINLILLLLLGYLYFRVFSKNIAKRYAENQKYLEIQSRVKQLFSKSKYRLEDMKTHHIYRCPGCGQKVRVPRGKGKIEITCPKCREKFIRKS